MGGAHRDNVRKINMAVDSLKSKAGIYANVANLNNKSLKTPLRDLMYASAPGKKVSKIGVAIFWVPEPTMISDVVGLSMIAGGKLLDRYYTGTTVKHVNEEARKTLNSLQDFLR